MADERLTKAGQRILALLDDWCEAISQGTVSQRLPAPHYTRRSGLPLWTEAELQGLFRDLDSYILAQRGWAQNLHHEDFDSAPGYGELPIAQLLALAQELDHILKEEEPEPQGDPGSQS